MKLGKTYKLKLRRRYEGKTDYRKRMSLLKSGLPRVVVRRTNYRIIVQIVDFDRRGDKTLCQASSNELEKYGWKCSKKNLPAAYLTGFLCGKRTVKLGKLRNNEAVLDMGLYRSHKGGRIFSALKGIIDAGIKVPCGDVLPEEERMIGAHIDKYASKVSKASNSNSFQFSKTKAFAERTSKMFENVKNKIEGEFNGRK